MSNSSELSQAVKALAEKVDDYIRVPTQASSVSETYASQVNALIGDRTDGETAMGHLQEASERFEEAANALKSATDLLEVAAASIASG